MKPRKRKYIKKILTIEQINEAKELYKTTPIYKLSKIYNCCQKVLTRNLLENGVILKSYAERSTKYTLDDNFFKSVKEWEEKHSYFLGWLMSDGHHNVKHTRIQIRLQEKDKKILDILKNIIKYTGPLNFLKRESINDFIKKSTKKWQSRWGLNITSKQITTDLLRLGIDNDKTNNLEFPAYLKEELIPHYLRSFYEGDGTISYSMYKNNTQIKFALNVIATRPFILTLQKILKDKIEIESQILIDRKIKNGNIVLRFAGKLNALKFFNYVYKDASFVLKRKFTKFLKLINHIKKEFKLKRKPHGYKRLRPELNKSILIAKNIIQNAEY